MPQNMGILKFTKKQCSVTKAVEMMARRVWIFFVYFGFFAPVSSKSIQRILSICVYCEFIKNGYTELEWQKEM